MRIRQWLVFLIPLAIALALVAGLGSSAFANDRVALVIGNGAYRSAPQLRNPANDARAVSQALTGLGFQVTSAIDSDTEGMRRALQEFGSRAGGAKMAVLYYAGHAVQVDARNYLIAVDSNIATPSDLEFQTVPMDLIVRTLARSPGAKILILDACRNNPFRSQLATGVSGVRSLVLSEGLAKIDAAPNTYIVFSTAPDSVALDGSDANSPFTSALVANLSTPGDVQEMMRRVRRDVIRTTSGRQTPWDQSSLTEDVFFANAAERGAAPLLTGGIGPAIDGVRLGQPFSAVKAKYGDKVQFFAQYQNGTQYTVDASDDMRVTVFVNAADDTIATLATNVSGPSRGAVERAIRPLLASANIDLASIAVTNHDEGLSERERSSEFGRMLAAGEGGMFFRGQQSQRGNVPCAPGSFQFDCARPTVGAADGYAISVMLGYSPESNSATLLLEANGFQATSPIYDRWRDHDIDIVHFAKRAFASDGPYSRFHGLYGVAACRPTDEILRTADRLNKLALWSSPGKLFVRYFNFPLGEYRTLDIVGSERRRLTLEGRPASMELLRVRERLEDGRIETFRIALVDQEEWTDVREFGETRWRERLGGRAFQVIGDDGEPGAFMRRCAEADSLVNGASTITPAEIVR